MPRTRPDSTSARPCVLPDHRRHQRFSLPTPLDAIADSSPWASPHPSVSLHRTQRAPIFRRKPLDIIRVDLPLVLSLFCLLSVVLYPFRVPAGIVPDPASRNLPWLWLWYAPLQLGLILASLASTGAIVVGLSLFGPWGVLAVLGTVLLFMAQAHFLQPGLVFEYTHPSIDTAMKDQHADEEWLIINGVATADYRTPVRFLSKACAQLSLLPVSSLASGRQLTLVLAGHFLLCHQVRTQDHGRPQQGAAGLLPDRPFVSRADPLFLRSPSADCRCAPAPTPSPSPLYAR